MADLVGSVTSQRVYQEVPRNLRGDWAVAAAGGGGQAAADDGWSVANEMVLNHQPYCTYYEYEYVAGGVTSTRYDTCTYRTFCGPFDL